MSSKSQRTRPQVVGFLGLGLDNSDGHKRITRNEDFLLIGGSEETHERMQDLSIKFNESLQERGKRLPDTEIEEVIDLLHKAADL